MKVETSKRETKCVKTGVERPNLDERDEIKAKPARRPYSANLFEFFVMPCEHLMPLEEEVVFKLRFAHLIFLVELSLFHFPNGRLSSAKKLLLLLQKLLFEQRDLFSDRWKRNRG